MIREGKHSGDLTVVVEALVIPAFLDVSPEDNGLDAFS